MDKHTVCIPHHCLIKNRVQMIILDHTCFDQQKQQQQLCDEENEVLYDHMNEFELFLSLRNCKLYDIMPELY